ncbi:MAG: COX15/CtaA family protein [Planctomycetota bacterium]|nr:COX15/CtaA family protein [Planctomycetota bacterium]
MSARADQRDPSRWPHLLAAAAVLFAVPLVLFGGSVTTLGAGMAVEGWLIAEGHFLLFFPAESWLRDTATFVEHTHRLFGVLVGLAAIGACVAAWRLDRRASAGWLATLALLAVCAQGVLGGFRVLENDPQLAFLHGFVAQVVFALLAASAVFLSRTWIQATATRRSHDADGDAGGGVAGLRTLAVLTGAAVLAQVLLGAWYRHEIRPVVGPAAATRLAWHVVGAVVVLLLGVLLARALARAARTAPEPGAARLRRGARAIAVLLGLQIVLGMVAWLAYEPLAIGPLEWTVSILHVLGGALLLAHCTVATMWSWRLFEAPFGTRPALGLEGAR